MKQTWYLDIHFKKRQPHWHRIGNNKKWEHYNHRLEFDSEEAMKTVQKEIKKCIKNDECFLLPQARSCYDRLFDPTSKKLKVRYLKSYVVNVVEKGISKTE